MSQGMINTGVNLIISVLFVTFLFILFLTWFIGYNSVTPLDLYPKYKDTPYCKESKTSVGNMSVSIKRCFKIVEVIEDEEDTANI